MDRRGRCCLFGTHPHTHTRYKLPSLLSPASFFTRQKRARLCFSRPPPLSRTLYISLSSRLSLSLFPYLTSADAARLVRRDICTSFGRYIYRGRTYNFPASFRVYLSARPLLLSLWPLKSARVGYIGVCVGGRGAKSLYNFDSRNQRGKSCRLYNRGEKSR